jgi:hypothetical protein
MPSKDSNRIAFGRTIFISERGHDRNNGLTAETPVRTGARAVCIYLKEKGTAFQITGNQDFVRCVNAELEKKLTRRL